MNSNNVKPPLFFEENFCEANKKIEKKIIIFCDFNKFYL